MSRHGWGLEDINAGNDFAFGVADNSMREGGLMSKDLNKAHTTLQEFIPKLQTWYAGKHLGQTLEVFSVDRISQEQLLLFCKGRVSFDVGNTLIKAGLIDQNAVRVTEKDGYNNKSRHNFIPSEAVDLVVKINGNYAWADSYYTDIGKCIFELGYSGELRWGGSWGDMGHIETR